MSNIQTILAPSTNHQQIIKKILQNEIAKPNISLLPFHVFLSQLTSAEHEAWLFSKAYEIIQKQKQNCTTLTNSLHYPEIVQQLITFAKECISYDINIESLPAQTPKEIDIKLCIQAIYPIFSKITTLNLVKNSIENAQNIMIYPFYQTLSDKKIVDYLKSKNAETKEYTVFNNPDRKVYFALNIAKEAEAVAQWLHQNKDKKTLLVCCDTSTLPLLLTTSLNRYNIDFSIDFSYKPSLIVDHFLILYRFYLHKGMDLLKECLSNEVFDNQHFNELLTYINLIDLPIENIKYPLNHFNNIEKYNALDERDQVKLKVLEKKAEIQRNLLMKYINGTNENPLLTAFEMITSNIKSYDSLERQILFNIKEIIEQMIFSNLKTEYQPIVLEHLLSSLSLSKSSKPKKVMITTLKNGYQTGYECVIILGANQQNFPGFSKKTGIIDEIYLKSIDYPSLEERLLFHTSQLEYLQKSAPEIIVSYATSTFEGKTLSESFDLVQGLLKKAWPLSIFGHTKENDYQLSPAIAQKLFFKDYTLFGSVSSFEVFFQCHYRYFLQYGLRLSKSDVEPTLVAMIGTISHAIVEELSTGTISVLTDESLKDKINHYFSDLYKLYPHQQHYWEFIELRLYKQIKLALLRLQETEKHTDFEFFEAERRFEVTWGISEQHKLALTGYIDRIDMTNEFFRIVDYKSSEKNLSLKKVKAGLQLQLLTYLVVADHIFSQKASGVHYFSFLNKVVNIFSQKVNKNQILSYTEDDYLELFYRNHKMSSWFIADDASMYHSDWFMKNITPKYNIRKNCLYDLKKIEEFLITIYTSMINTLDKGDIQRNPTQGACTYCDFRYICIFKGKYREYEDYQSDNTLKGDDGNA